MMNDTLLSAISRSKDRAWLSRCRDFNLSNGRKDVAVAVDHRLRELEFTASLEKRDNAHTVEDRVMESLRIYRALLKLKHGRNQAAGYSEREIRQYGHREALIRTIRRGKRTDGLRLLAAHGRLDCAYEQIAIDHAHEMPEDVVEKARQLLAEQLNSEN
jgi:hypothetical protein